MKRTLLILLLSLLGTSSFGQKIRFSDSTNLWTVFEYSCGGDPYVVDSVIFRYTNDTVIHDTLYQRLYHKYGAGFLSFIREDTSLKKVFAISAIHDTDTTEKVLYDYTLNVGDTLKGVYTTQYVSSIDSVIINSIWHKIWYFSPTKPWGDSGSSFVGYTVIEGIGCINSPLYPLYPYFFEGCTTLTCFANNGTKPTLSRKIDTYFDNNSSCSLTYGLGINNIVNKSQGVVLAPDPITESSKITLPYILQSGSLIIFNDIGQSIINTIFQNKDELFIGDKVYSPGIYFYRVMDNQSGKVFSGKFVNQ